MGVTYFYLPDSSLLVSGYWGLIDPPESQRMRTARAEDPRRLEAQAHLIDLSLLEGTLAPVRAEAQIYHALGVRYGTVFGPLKTAIIAQSDHVFGLARIFATVAGLQEPPIPVKIASRWAEAAEYLGIDLGPAKEELRRRREG